MLRPATRQLLRQNGSLVHKIAPARRHVSTTPSASRSRSWRSSAVRWGLAIGLVYWYNTSSTFAEEASAPLPPPPPPSDESSLPTIDTIARVRKPDDKAAELTDMEKTEEEASQEAAFNEETGEINWDCPCLGGMAHGPCGEEFRQAFSCFVHSTEEPKGMDCIDHFKTMQDCFRQHPDVYGSELDGDEDEDEINEAVGDGQPSDPTDKSSSTSSSPSSLSPSSQASKSSSQQPAAKAATSSRSGTSATATNDSISDKTAKVVKKVDDTKNKVKDTVQAKASDVKDSLSKINDKKPMYTDASDNSSSSQDDEVVPKAARDAR